MEIAEWSIGTFLQRVASRRLTPSGGAVAAVGGAMGAALCEMVCTHTDGALTEAAATLAAARERLLALADEDAAAVRAFDDALAGATDAGDEGETDGRTAALEAAHERLLTVPIETAETCLLVVETAEAVLAEGNERAVADGVTGVLLAAAALEAAVYTARTNVEDDPATVARLEELEADARAAKADALAVVAGEPASQ